MANPYQSPETTQRIDPAERVWKGGAEATLIQRGLLQRKVIVSRPVEVTIEYFARGLRDRILVDGVTVLATVPILWLHEVFDFEIPFQGGVLPASVRLKTGRRSLKLARFEIEINGILVYRELDGKPVDVEDRPA